MAIILRREKMASKKGGKMSDIKRYTSSPTSSGTKVVPMVSSKSSKTANQTIKRTATPSNKKG